MNNYSCLYYLYEMKFVYPIIMLLEAVTVLNISTLYSKIPDHCLPKSGINE